jgi:hypothetical protein
MKRVKAQVLTLGQLAKLGACGEATRKFSKAFPSGKAAVNEKNVLKAMRIGLCPLSLLSLTGQGHNNEEFECCPCERPRGVAATREIERLARWFCSLRLRLPRVASGRGKRG